MRDDAIGNPDILLKLSVIIVGLLVVSGIMTSDRATWLMEVAPVVIALPVLWYSRRRFPLTDLAYLLIFTHASVLIMGGMYTYARVPAGFWLQEQLGLERNPYDRIGHFFQGFVPALVAREILIRVETIRSGKMLAFLCVCIVMMVSAVYELIEWGAALALGQGAAEFLGTQGDPWDTQADMLCALIGAISALILLSALHDRELLKLAIRQRNSYLPNQ